jgi:hypothetical protein
LRLNQEEELRFRLRSWQVDAGAELQPTTIVFIALSALLHKLETDWARDCDKVILRYCPVCKRIPSSATDAAARRRTISITIGLGSVAVSSLVAARPSLSSRCYLCLTRITVCWRTRRHYGDARWNTALGNKWRLCSKTLIRCPILRCWSRGLDSSQPALSFLRKTLARMTQWVRGDRVDHHARLLSWLTPVCQVLWPLRL